MLIPAGSLPDLPVRPVLAEVAATLADAGAAVLVAPPGTGKTTLVPLALAAPGHRVIVAEPRRVAARAAARRMATLLGEPVGRRVGFAVRGERQVSRETLVEVVTTGLLVRRLQGDPELAGATTVILDECHERHLDSDLALAFLVEVRAALRPELRLLATSATADSERLAAVLGEPGHPAPVLTAHARTHPVEVIWAPPAGTITPPHGLRVDPRLLDHVAATTRRALTEGDGDVLVFLPGAREIETVAGRLGGSGVDVVTLHGRQAGAAQDAALRAGPHRRVVLATAVAESSLTVPGVRAVVDAGLSRVPRMDHARGLGALATVPVSRSSAEQRAGRAGREAPGRVYRCWSPALHDRLPAQPSPEIAAADLTGFALDLALWGHPGGHGLALPDQPPAGALSVATATLHDLGAIDTDGRVTSRGRALAGAGLHPRLARALLDGAATLGVARAAEIVAVLDDDRTATDDVVTVWRNARNSNDSGWRAEVRRLTRAVDRAGDPPPTSPPTPTDRPARRHEAQPARTRPADTHTPKTRRHEAQPTGTRPADTHTPETRRHEAQPTGTQPADTHTPETRRHEAQPTGTRPTDTHTAGIPQQEGPPAGVRLADDLAAGLVIGLAYPERVARVREPGGRSYLMAGGTAAELPAGSSLAGASWLAVASADRPAGARVARIRSAAPLDEETAREVAAPLLGDATEIGWNDGDVVARRVQRLGAITLVSSRLADPDPVLLRAALVTGLRQEGLGLLTWSRNAEDLRRRLAFAWAAIGEPWPDVSDAALLESPDDWLDLGSARRRADLAKLDVATGLRRLVPWSVAGRLDEIAPERLPVPSGSQVRVDYSDPEAPVLAVKVQEAFGWKEAPRLADGRVPVLLHLLSPAGRPVAVTRDLGSFWVQGYPQVRAEMRGRYPRHPWPEDPTTAQPTRRLNPRSR
ncbi:ATP-dependent helicase C-terminal domain-containing protein [Actinoplanes sp. NEAU-A12]|uniref:ATP-dependent helicase C-terminal domain-containing protein n=1 Tax=Actinoplanes sandaracinus TaxID=3045177 RepID=A0ABT6WP99_9ACTN|nr:ATP-dependent helicase C-terminal domain-containing protein [Actinoplanes sandaracinus]MDI6101519.1 ATP-dependent helicase C-terminal domain-containing protein [Actinoplanes sandaracinus]